MKNLKNIACLIRTWSDNGAIADTVNRAMLSGIGHVLVVVKDDDKKHEGSVASLLAGLIEAHENRITVLLMREGYSWANALNYGFDEVRRFNLRAAEQGAERITYVLNVSNEALYTPEDIAAMLAEAETDEAIGAVGTSFQGWHNDRPIDLGASYAHPRNTMMLVKFSSYLAIGGFDPRCDLLGGQEDVEWLARLSHADFRWTMLDRKVKLLVGRNFDQAEKEARELKAVTAIAEMQAEVAKNLADIVDRLK